MKLIHDGGTGKSPPTKAKTMTTNDPSMDNKCVKVNNLADVKSNDRKEKVVNKYIYPKNNFHLKFVHII